MWFWLIVIVTSIGVGVDASSNGIKAGQTKGLFNMGPLGWCLACLLIWIVAFPAYLIKRSDLIAAANGQVPAAAPSAPGYAPPPVAPAQRYCTSCGTALSPAGAFCPGCGTAAGG
jgi:hypothetical protein